MLRPKPLSERQPDGRFHDWPPRKVVTLQPETSKAGSGINSFSVPTAAGSIASRTRSKTKSVTLMAASLLNKNLICFYCNLKSAQKQDGTIRQWDCRRCEATNYLDEHGEITDPPTSTTDNTAAVMTSFAQAIPPPEWSTAASQDSVFCDKCIKNQHLCRASLAQYLPDESDPEYTRMLNNLETFKADLEHRYPQVCENCVDRVQSKIKRAVYGAKAHAHGQLLERTRLNGGPGAKPRTWLDLLHNTGATAWAWGLYLQIACLVVLLIFGFTQISIASIGDDSLLSSDAEGAALTSSVFGLMTSFIFDLPTTSIIALPPAAKASLLLSFASIWWNPQWRFMKKQNVVMVFGLREWYAQQFTLLSLRVIAWLGLDTWYLGDAGSSLMLALHALVLAFTLWNCKYASKKVTMKPRKLFATAPDRETLLPKRKNSGSSTTPGKSTSLWDALESLVDEPTVPSSPVTPTSTINYASPDSQRRAGSLSYAQQQTPSKASSRSLFARKSYGASAVVADTVGSPDPDAMEWVPTAPQHRAFNSYIDNGNKAPIAPRGVFWYKVPQAPMTPARKLRNPPAAPPPPPPEKKEIFFTKENINRPLTTTRSYDKRIRDDYQIARPKFFPAGSDEDDTGLADLFGKVLDISDDNEVAEREDTYIQSSARRERRHERRQQRNQTPPTPARNAWIMRAAICVGAFVIGKYWYGSDAPAVKGNGGRARW